MVSSPEEFTHEIGSCAQNNDGGDSRYYEHGNDKKHCCSESKSSKHGDDDKHCSRENKSSKHKHKHHKHKHRRKHKKGNAEAGAEEMASDAGDRCIVDPEERVCRMKNTPEENLERAVLTLQVKNVSENSAGVIDAVLTQNEQIEMGAEIYGMGEIRQSLQCLHSVSDNMHKVDDEVEEGEILDEDTAVCQVQGVALSMDSLLANGLEQSYGDTKDSDNSPPEVASIKFVENADSEIKSEDTLSESTSMDASGGKEEIIKYQSPQDKGIDLERVSPASVSPGNTRHSVFTRRSSERIPERSRRSRSISRDFKHLKNSLRQCDYDRQSMSRDNAYDASYARSNHDRTNQKPRSRSREVDHNSRHADDSRRLQENGFEKQDACTLYRERHSRSRGHGQLEYAERKRSTSRSGREYPGRRRSRSRGVPGDNMDKRRRSRSIESSQDRNRKRRSRSTSRIGRDYPVRRRSRSRGVHGDHLDKTMQSRSIENSQDRNRRRSPSRSARDSTYRRRSRSRGGYREHMDRRSRSRSKERSRDQRVNDSMSYRSSRLSRGVERDKVSEGEHTHKAEVETLKEADTTMREEEDEEPNIISSWQSQDEDIDKEVEKIRLRRQAILEKHKKQEQLESMKNADLNVVRLDVSDSTGTVNANISLDKHASVDSDYSEKAFNLDKGSLQNGFLDRPVGQKGLGQGTPKSEEKSNEMVNDYIFGESPAGGRKQVKGDGLAFETSGLTDNWDDAEGYYCHRIGEVLDGRYEIAASHGRGVFSSVVRARDARATRKDLDEIAVKIIRNNDVMLKSGQQELSILRKLDGADPENRRHCVRFVTSFDYRKHLCLVFESMHMNLREVLKKFGRNIGLNLGAVRSYAKQLFIALKHLRNCGVLHCDIKPDNMLVNEAKNTLKLCDFGSAMFAGENEITPYLVSRFYRAPEIILGLPYDHPLDMWSVGCCLYEFFTGKVLFPGPTNNDMLRLHMELKGPFPKKMLKKAAFMSQHFDQDYNFCAVDEDPVTKASIKRILVNVKPKDIAALVTGQGVADESGKMLNNFRDLLDKIFMLDPEKRLTVSQALSHPFVTGK